MFRLGHAARSARYATSIAQLVVGLAPVMGWGPVPRGGSERARFVRAHRRSVQRWLDDLQMAGLVVHEPECDARGSWWRTQIVLQRAPALEPAELEHARGRARGWRARERARRAAPRRASNLSAIRARSGVPSARLRAQLARRRRAHRDLTHPFGAPTANTPEGPAVWSSAQAFEVDGAAVVETGARGHAPPAARTAGIEELMRLSPVDLDAVIAERVAERQRSTAWRTDALRGQVTARAREVLDWPAGRACPSWRLREAWVVQRYGPAKAADSGTALAGRTTPELIAATRRAIRRYETHAAHRPPGWPASGAAALCVLAEHRRADRFAGDVARLAQLAKGMQAAALERGPDRLTRARNRACRRRHPSPGPLTIDFRRPPRAESAEGRRTRVRDAVLLAGADPASWPNAELALRHAQGIDRPPIRLLEPDRFEELDGTGARAARYRDQLNQDVWRLP